MKSADEIMNVVYRSFYTVNGATIQSGYDEKTLREIRKAWNNLIEEIKKNALAAGNSESAPDEADGATSHIRTR